MSNCYEHDYESVFCRNCGGYCGMACVNCNSMTDGGEQTYVTMEWCHCNNQVFDFGFEEPANDESRPTTNAADICQCAPKNDPAGYPEVADGWICTACGKRR